MDAVNSSSAWQLSDGAPHGAYSSGVDARSPSRKKGSGVHRASRDEEQALLRYQELALDEAQPRQKTQAGALQLLITVSLSVAFMLVSTALIVANKHIVKDLDFR
jgi:hypothetical protein